MDREYEVTADDFDRHTLNEDGTRVLKTERYHRGDKVTMPEDEAERLVKTGGLRAVGEDEPEATPNLAVPTAAVSGQTAEQSLRAGTADATGAGESETEQPGAADASVIDNVGGDTYDNADEYSYADLQDLAKERDLSAGGSRDELVARLREYDQEQRQEATE